MDEPGQDVEHFGNNMVEMACWISGTGSTPIDLSTLDANAFIDCKVLAFQTKATGLHDLVDSNAKALSVDEIIWNLENKFRYLKAQGLWIPSEEDKLDTDGELDELNLDMNNMVESYKRGHTSGNDGYKYGKTRDLSVITCFSCHNTGHFQDNCPLEKKAVASSGNEENPATISETSTAWR